MYRLLQDFIKEDLKKNPEQNQPLIMLETCISFISFFFFKVASYPEWLETDKSQ